MFETGVGQYVRDRSRLICSRQESINMFETGVG